MQKTKQYKPMWEIRQQADPNVKTLDLYIYGDVEAETWVRDEDGWWGHWEEAETSANHFRDVLAQFPGVEQINLYINSYGGSVFEGTAIYNQLKRHSAHKTVYVDGFACSIASIIAMAGDEIVMPRNALMMIHNMWMTVIGNAEELRKAADDLDVINNAGRAAYLLKAGGKLDEEKLAEMMTAETWLTAAQCIEFGLADRFADEDADMSGAAEVLQRANLNVEQRINLQKGLCAQLRALVADEPPKAGQTPPEENTGENAPKNAAEGGKSGDTGKPVSSVMALFKDSTHKTN